MCYSMIDENKCLKAAQDFAYECLINTKVITEDMSQIAKTYRYEHSLRVYRCGEMLADDMIKRGFKVNKFVVLMACMLHDIGKFEAFLIPNKSHGLVGSEMARPFLKELGIDDKTCEDICYCIACHSGEYNQYDYEDIIEAHLTEEADDIDRYGMLRVLAKISDWHASCSDSKSFIEKSDNYCLRLENHKAKMHCVSPLARKILEQEINLQIDAFKGYRDQYARTVGVDLIHVQDKHSY